ncbi:hypothetical protein [Cellvibrio mixtus]|nr:hypothetical protein [Cellvibrio mixtus]
MTKRWFDGVTDAEHEAHMAQIENQIASAERWVKEVCKKDCR